MSDRKALRASQDPSALSAQQVRKEMSDRKELRERKATRETKVIRETRVTPEKPAHRDSKVSKV